MAKRSEDYDALRAENARLRGLLAEIQYDCEQVWSLQHLDKAERRTWVSVANRIKAALQQRIWCDRCHEDLPTWKFESMDARLALWFCDNCYEIMTGEAT